MEEKEEEDASKREIVRIHVGGLGGAVSPDELRRIFELAGGSVDKLEFVRTKGRSFAYVNFLPSSHNSLSKLFAKYNGCVWKGGKLRLGKAKEHYLIRLKREWAQEEEEEEAAAAVAQIPPDSSETPQNAPTPENTDLRIFFPKLRKVKSLPFTGTGKHKYSFQRTEVPSLPKYFCDCEEHSCLSSSTGKETRVPHLESQSAGVNEEELNIMNKVMNTLFQKQNDELHFDENEADEDNLIINVVANGHDRVASFSRQQVPLVSKDQEPRSKRGPFGDVFTVQKGNDNGPPNKKKKSLFNDRSYGNEIESAISADKGNLQQPHSNKSGKLAEVQIAELKSSKQKPSSHVSWSQKSSWKELVGERGRNEFSISHTVPDNASAKESQLQSATPNVPDYDSKNENLERDGECEDTLSGMKTAQSDLPNVVSTEEGQLRSDTPNVPGFDNKNEHLERDGEFDGTSSRMETEGLVEAPPAEPNVVSSQTARGAFWRKKSSWTQLISENSSFSISQLTPGISFDQQNPTKPKDADIVNSADGKLDEMVNSTRDDPSVSGMGKQEDDSKSTREENQQTTLGNNESSAPMLEEKCGVAAKQTSAAKVEISETCSFMRSAASLKEWAKTKAALSGSIKRKGTSKPK